MRASQHIAGMHAPVLGESILRRVGLLEARYFASQICARLQKQKALKLLNPLTRGVNTYPARAKSGSGKGLYFAPLGCE